MLWSVICVMFWRWEAWVLFTSLHICDLPGGSECRLTLWSWTQRDHFRGALDLNLCFKDSRGITVAWRISEGETGREISWSVSGQVEGDLRANQREDLTYRLLFSLSSFCGIHCGPTPFMRMMQDESCHSLFFLRATEVINYHQLLKEKYTLSLWKSLILFQGVKSPRLKVQHVNMKPLMAFWGRGEVQGL